MDLYINFTTDVSVDKKELIKFWKSSASGSGTRNFLKGFSNSTRYGIFPQFGSYLRTNDRIFMKILPQMLIWTTKSLFNFGSHVDWESGSGVGPHHLCRGLRSPSVLLCMVTALHLATFCTCSTYYLLSICSSTVSVEQSSCCSMETVDNTAHFQATTVTRYLFHM